MIKKDPDVDKALEYMEKHYPGPHDLKKIADFCGISHQSLRRTYDSALKKVRARLAPDLLELNDD